MGIDFTAAGQLTAVRWNRQGAITRLQTLPGYANGEPYANTDGNGDPYANGDGNGEPYADGYC